MYTIYYTVSEGDTLWNIAEQFGTTVNDISRYNGIANPDQLSVGQRLRIPIIEIDIPRWYVVRPGDTVHQIAKRFNVPMSEIVNLNNLSNPDLIYPGQVLQLKR